MRKAEATRILGPGPDSAGKDAEPGREERRKTFPGRINVYSPRREEPLDESPRDRLIAQVYRPAAKHRDRRGHSPALSVLATLAAIDRSIA